MTPSIDAKFFDAPPKTAAALAQRLSPKCKTQKKGYHIAVKNESLRFFAEKLRGKGKDEPNNE
jgi:hypothetical protein